MSKILWLSIETYKTHRRLASDVPYRFSFVLLILAGRMVKISQLIASSEFTLDQLVFYKVYELKFGD